MSLLHFFVFFILILVRLKYNQNRVGSQNEQAITIKSNKDIYEELKKIGELRDSGILTDEEFGIEKAKLLNQNK